MNTKCVSAMQDIRDLKAKIEDEQKQKREYEMTNCKYLNEMGILQAKFNKTNGELEQVKLSMTKMQTSGAKKSHHGRKKEQGAFDGTNFFEQVKEDGSLAESDSEGQSGDEGGRRSKRKKKRRKGAEKEKAGNSQTQPVGSRGKPGQNSE